MWRKTSSILISFVVIAVSGNFCLADCPSADLTGDCFVDYEDFAVMAAQWLTTGPCVPDDMVLIPGGTYEMGDSFDEGDDSELPVHTVTVDSFYMTKYEITNEQYCDYLNSALSQGLITVTSGVVYKAGSGTSYPYCDTSTADYHSQIAYSGGVFTVRTKNGRDMSNDPMVEVSWYGAAAYCNWRSQQERKEQCYNLSTWNCDFSKHGYRLATEAEWEYAARGGLSGRRFPWGDTISHSRANYNSYWSGGHPYYSYDVSPTQGYHPSWNDGVNPYTSPVGSFAANGYGLYDMAGNVWEWCNDWWDSDYYDYSPTNNPTGPIDGSYRVLRGGGWYDLASGCRVAHRYGIWPYDRYYSLGFRIVLDLSADRDIPDDMRYIPAGEFEMGDSFDEGQDSELPVHTVTVDSFYMGKYEITNQQYCAFLNWADDNGWITVTRGVVYKAGSGTSYPYFATHKGSPKSQIDYNDVSGVFSVRTKAGRDMSNDPILYGSWYGAVAYCNWRSQQEGKDQCYNLSTWDCDFSKKGYRLATEAEWEYAARGGLSGRRFPWGDTISHSQANYQCSWQGGSPYWPYDVSPTEGHHPTYAVGGMPYTAPVGSFSANGYGLYDMAGNVWEWCNDWYDSTYYASRPNPDVNPTGPAGPITYRVLRGGGWCCTAYACRVAARYLHWPDHRYNDIGFRLVLDLE